MSRDGFGVKSRGWVGERGEWLNWHSGRRLPDTSVHITIFCGIKKPPVSPEAFSPFARFYWCWASCFWW